MTDQTLVTPHAEVIAGLLVRLHDRSDDFAATRELQVVGARLAQLESQARRAEALARGSHPETPSDDTRRTARRRLAQRRHRIVDQDKRRDRARSSRP